MDCLEELPRIYIESWLGNLKEINLKLRECLKEYEDIREIQKTIRETLAEISSDVEIPTALRSKGISHEELLKLSLHRIFKSLIKNQIELKVMEREQLKYSVLDLEYKKVIRGVCSKCKNRKKFVVLKKSNGILVQYHQIIYAEIYGDLQTGIEEILENLE